MNRPIKIITTLIIIIAIVVLPLAGCSGGAVSDASETEDGRLRIVTTIFPAYDWVRNVLGDKADGADIVLLTGNGVDMHSFQPTVNDLIAVSECDLFVYVGGESDEWVEDALSEAVNKEMIVVNLMEVLGDKAKEEEITEGMKAPRGEDVEKSTDDGTGNAADESTDREEQSGEEKPEYDEHVWLSLRNAKIFTDSIADALSSLDPENADIYAKNAEEYKIRLEELDDRYTEAVGFSDKRVLLFGDRFPFRYLTDDYGLTYYAAFPGCSAETEASFETITFLAGKVNELSLGAVMTMEGSDKRIAETIVTTSGSENVKVLTMDSMQSVTEKDIESGAAYLSIMENNLKILEEALR